MTSIEKFLADKQAALVSYVNWGRQHLDFEVGSYFSTDIPPLELVTSVRGIVRYKDRVVVLENEDGKHFMPGGRREQDETFEVTLHREIEEECGLSVASSTLLGFLHFHHLQPRPEGHPYPYPDIFQLVFAVVGTGELSQADKDGYEFATHLYTADDALNLEDTDAGRPFLKYAMGL